MEGTSENSPVVEKPETNERTEGNVKVAKNPGNSAVLHKKNSMVRADLVNLADLDTALNRVHNKLPNSIETASAEPPAPPEEWEINPREITLKHMIARGTFGTVHKGVYKGQDVAVKLLEWGEENTMKKTEVQYYRNQFRQEVAVWHKLDHPNVTKFIGASMGNSDLRIPSAVDGDDGFHHVPNNACCVVVEYLAGGTLKDHLIRSRRKKLSYKVVVQLALDVSRGLAYLHSQKIAHRDVKTENMLLDKQMRVKIADFGVARVEASNPKDMTGDTGTPGYMAPEILDGKPYNKKCDVYSFGICLWEVYCCDMPYLDLSFADMTSAVVHQNLRPEVPKCCPQGLADIMRQCWDANPEKRPAMADVVQMLEALDTSKGGGMIPTDAQPHGCLCFGRFKGP
ncbi:serine/threonine-protein kinase 52 [Physcomitrium patens]|uniref:Protein kinase domain-containing protein n=1 Tax=Physcomitrium patens TaxID=3218 RepID=A0A2K1L8K4_PHYPA|nr:serine/threonine-protein kinase STY13-like [Physcomitrium patens]XP_024384838.1 serine/threonine-protein kinase STY13-like [Physcomitrium patens]XP_024384847.1 serine/threonine-protein kinase STY13-like [Physcomitrium patens]XP_024384853.1 serine/threonine-protein kinase STY13-like [Physcomitrium patens]XP_024384862.1 serine/threonine-protein kinase STY13-like [Physcomitrium patens]XP_024384872.1 serine/threonine-protein kinase STY13-like [Physcomitrium patens]XP_024384874.1 serine/threoni|eukprot:XP_024384828.1 serine/threonine-protein kinase STY13-like [Physcomitrella patens]